MISRRKLLSSASVLGAASALSLSQVFPQDRSQGLSCAGETISLHDNWQFCIDADDFFRGATWQIGLKRYLQAHRSTQLRLKVLPLRADAPIYLDPSVRSTLPLHGQISTVAHASLDPEYEAIAILNAGSDSKENSKAFTLGRIATP